MEFCPTEGSKVLQAEVRLTGSSVGRVLCIPGEKCSVHSHFLSVGSDKKQLQRTFIAQISSLCSNCRSYHTGHKNFAVQLYACNAWYKLHKPVWYFLSMSITWWYSSMLYSLDEFFLHPNTSVADPVLQMRYTSWCLGGDTNNPSNGVDIPPLPWRQDLTCAAAFGFLSTQYEWFLWRMTAIFIADKALSNQEHLGGKSCYERVLIISTNHH